MNAQLRWKRKMAGSKDSRSTPDLVFEILHAQATSAMPSEIRRTHGSTETMFVATEGYSAIGEILQTTVILHAGIVALAKERSLSSRLLSDSKSLSNELRQQLEKTIAEGAKREAAALQIVRDDFAPLNAMTLVSFAAAIEAAVEQTAISVLRYRPGTISRLLELGVKRIAAPCDRDLTYDEAFQAFTRLKEWAFGPSKPAPNALLGILDAVGLAINLSDRVKEDIREMIYVRNCIVHRQQRADIKASENATSLGLVQGQRFTVTRTHMGRYTDAALALTQAIAIAPLPEKHQRELREDPAPKT